MDVVKHPELKEYRQGGMKHHNILPVWAAFSYFEMGTIVMLYSYLRGDLRKEVLDYAYSGNNYKNNDIKVENELLKIAASLEKNSEHILAEAILEKAEERVSLTRDSCLLCIRTH